MTLRIEIPGEPVAFARSRHNGKFHFTPAKQRTAMEIIRYEAHQAMEHRPLLTGPLRLEAVFTYAWPASWSAKKRATNGAFKRSRPDASNLVKLCEDALNQIAWQDDALVVDLNVKKQYGDKPSTLIIITTLGGAWGAAEIDAPHSVDLGNEFETEKLPLRPEMSAAQQE